MKGRFVRWSLPLASLSITWATSAVAMDGPPRDAGTPPPSSEPSMCSSTDTFGSPPTLTSAVTASDPTHKGHLRGGDIGPTPSPTCGQTNTPPAVQDAAADFHYDTHTFRNRLGKPACVTVQLYWYQCDWAKGDCAPPPDPSLPCSEGGCGGVGPHEATAYLGSFDPNDIRKNFIADTGRLGSGPGQDRFSFDVPAGADFVIVTTWAGIVAPAYQPEYQLYVTGCGDGSSGGDGDAGTGTPPPPSDAGGPPPPSSAMTCSAPFSDLGADWSDRTPEVNDERISSSNPLQTGRLAIAYENPDRSFYCDAKTTASAVGTDEQFRYTAHTFRNWNDTEQCVRVAAIAQVAIPRPGDPDSGGDFGVALHQSASYLDAFDPNDVTKNYLAGTNADGGPGVTTYAFKVPPQRDFVVVVNSALPHEQSDAQPSYDPMIDLYVFGCGEPAATPATGARGAGETEPGSASPDKGKLTPGDDASSGCATTSSPASSGVAGLALAAAAIALRRRRTR